MNEVDNAADEMIEKIRLRGLQRDLDKVNADQERVRALAAELAMKKDILLASVDETQQRLEAIWLANQKWKPSGEQWLISNANVIAYARGSSEGCKQAGKYRDDRWIAERAAIEMNTHSRLLAYRDEFDPNFKWMPGGYNYYVSNSVGGEWRFFCDRLFSTPGIVYMSKAVAIELADKLNKGIVVL